MDVSDLQDKLSRRLGVRIISLIPIDVSCASPVYKACFEHRTPLFVKVTSVEAAQRTLAFLSQVRGSAFLPRPVGKDLWKFSGHAVLTLTWLDSDRIDAEKMSDEQLQGFLDGCRDLSRLLNDAVKIHPRIDAEDDPDRQHANLEAYRGRHPLAGRLLAPLCRIPAAGRSYAGRRLAVIHGDFQPANYGFAGNRLSAVYDTDDLTMGLPCEDAAYAFTERARRLELSRAERSRLTDLFLRLVAESGWPRDEWIIAINHARLRIAARRLAKRPDSPFVALDIARRDRPLRRLLEAVEQFHA